jgi:succinoglycan biosynthesis transport protein ExoP
MSQAARSIVSPRQLVSTLRRHCVLWTAPTIALTVLAVGYGIVRPVEWRASQALIVRDEAGGSTTTRQGRFDTSEAMKAAQETVVQMSQNPSMIKAALVEAGTPDGSHSPIGWPTRVDIESLQDVITVSPPKGGEFGRSEVIYLSVDGPTRERAVVLTKAVCNQLEFQLQGLRRAKAQSLIAELEKTVSLGEGDLAKATTKLEDIEQSVGSDIDELRALTETTSGTSNLRGTSNHLQEEIRRTQLVHDGNAEQLKLLTAARHDYNRLLAAPQRLFEQQPALRRLKEGLVDAQLRTAQLLGRMSTDHPEVKAATLAEDQIRTQLNSEIDLVVSNLQNELKVSAALLQTLRQQHAEIDGRLKHVASLRADYANLLAVVRQRTENLAQASKDLADVRASQAAALSSSQIARLDEPQPGNSPVGPGFTTIVAAGFGGGLTLGFGLVFLTAPLGNLWGRRWSDYIGLGRRAADKNTIGNAQTAEPTYGRRAEDAPRGATQPQPKRQAAPPQTASQQVAPVKSPAGQPSKQKVAQQAQPPQTKPAPSQPATATPVKLPPAGAPASTVQAPSAEIRS